MLTTEQRPEQCLRGSPMGQQAIPQPLQDLPPHLRLLAFKRGGEVLRKGAHLEKGWARLELPTHSYCYLR